MAITTKTTRYARTTARDKEPGMSLQELQDITDAMPVHQRRKWSFPVLQVSRIVFHSFPNPYSSAASHIARYPQGERRGLTCAVSSWSTIC
jgi:hypothetical protein